MQLINVVSQLLQKYANDSETMHTGFNLTSTEHYNDRCLLVDFYKQLRY